MPWYIYLLLIIYFQVSIYTHCWLAYVTSCHSHLNNQLPSIYLNCVTNYSVLTKFGKYFYSGNQLTISSNAADLLPFSPTLPESTQRL